MNDKPIIVGQNGSPLESEPALDLPPSVLNEYSDQQAELINSEVTLFIESLEDGEEPNLEVIAKGDDRALVTIEKTVVYDNFPIMKWEEKTIAHVLFRNVGVMNVPTEVERYWEKH